MAQWTQDQVDDAAEFDYLLALGLTPEQIADQKAEAGLQERAATGLTSVEDKIRLATGVEVGFGGGPYLVERQPGVYRQAVWVEQSRLHHFSHELEQGERVRGATLTIDGSTWVRLVPNVPEERQVGPAPGQASAGISGVQVGILAFVALAGAYWWWRSRR